MPRREHLKRERIDNNLHYTFIGGGDIRGNEEKSNTGKEDRYVKKLVLVPLIIIFTLGLILTGCGEEEEAQSGGVWRIIMTEGPSGSIGVPGNMMASLYWAEPMLESLLTADSEGNIYPSLATDWEWTNNHTTVTFTLRKGVKFHDGTDFNADAVKWNWDQAMAKGLGGAQFVASTEVIDDYTFRVNLTEFQSTWFISLVKMETNLGWIISPTAVQEHGEEYIDWHPVGTGPFKFKDYARDNYLEVERNDDYWGEKPYLDGIKFIFIADPIQLRCPSKPGKGTHFLPRVRWRK